MLRVAVGGAGAKGSKGGEFSRGPKKVKSTPLWKTDQFKLNQFFSSTIYLNVVKIERK